MTRLLPVTGLLVALTCAAAMPALAATESLNPKATALDRQIDWSRARLIAVQDGGRYKTLESFAREQFTAMTGKEHLPGLSACGSLLEWVFNSPAYQDKPLIYVKDAIFHDAFKPYLSANSLKSLVSDKHITPGELASPQVQQTIRELARDVRKVRAINRIRNAQAVAELLPDYMNIVPQPGDDPIAAWHPPQALFANLPPEQMAMFGVSSTGGRIEGLSPDLALKLIVAWSSLRQAWLDGNGADVQRRLDELAATLPTVATAGMYPSATRRAAETQYYALGKFTWGWIIYFAAFTISVFALASGWRWAWWLTLVLVLAGLAFHAYGVALRWYILERIPLGNIFEAVVSSAVLGVAIAVIIELFLKTRVLLVGASAMGCAFLMAGQSMLPGSELSALQRILDDIMLRIHTLMITWAYALIFIAAVVAVVYLFGYYRYWWQLATGRVKLVTATARLPESLAMARGGTAAAVRPLLAGAAPGDEAGGTPLPAWLNQVDWAHLIIINIAFIFLFVGGVVLGALWADYSWGRPWGWDPKEVFALNTWIVYAILIHMRFVVKNRGLWTAWLSVIGCAMMLFNWFVVNFYIVGLHSYA